jgi:hypothetical protein
MKTKAILTFSVAATLAVAITPAMTLTAAPLRGIPRLVVVKKATFSGEPFPFGYRWSRQRACTQYVPVESTDGRTQWQRVWVCQEKKGHFPFFD